MSDRRSDTRFPLQVDVSIQIGNAERRTCACENMSTGGMCVRLDDPNGLAIGTPVAVEFRLPGLPNPVSVHGEVRWRARTNDRIVGIAFSEGLRAREVWALQQLRKCA